MLFMPFHSEIISYAKMCIAKSREIIGLNDYRIPVTGEMDRENYTVQHISGWSDRILA